MLKKLLVCVSVILALTVMPILAADKPAAKAAAKKGSDNKNSSGSMTLIDAIRAAQDECNANYPGATPFKAEYKMLKSGNGKYEVSLKVNEESFVKVTVSSEGKCKLNDKKGELFPMKKSGKNKGEGKDKESKKGKGKGKKKAAAEDAEPAEE